MQCFSINSEEIKNRIDPLFYSRDILSIIKSSSYNKYSLGDIVDYFKTGFAAGKSEQSDISTGIIQIRPTNINEDRLLCFDKNVYIASDNTNFKKQNLIQKGEVLFNNTNSQELVGKTAFFDIDGEFFCSNHITRIGVNKEIVNPKYLTFVLNFLQENNVFYNTCTNWNNQSGINIELLKTYLIPIPDLNWQNKIVDLINISLNNKLKKEQEIENKLFNINNIIIEVLGVKTPETKEKQCYTIQSLKLKNNRIDVHYHQPKFSVLEQYLKDCNCNYQKIKDVSCKISSGATPLSGGSSYSTNKGVPFIRSGDINKYDVIDYSKTLYIKEEVHNKTLKSSQLAYGDVLIAIVGATIGQVSVYKDQKPANINQALALVRIDKSKILPEYLKIYMLSKFGQEELNRNKRPVARANLNLDEIGNINILLPNLEQQRCIISEYYKILEQVQELKQEAKKEYAEAKAQIEKMIFGDE